jgi:hypothetical protein
MQRNSRDCDGSGVAPAAACECSRLALVAAIDRSRLAAIDRSRLALFLADETSKGSRPMLPPGFRRRSSVIYNNQYHVQVLTLREKV